MIDVFNTELRSFKEMAKRAASVILCWALPLLLTLACWDDLDVVMDTIKGGRGYNLNLISLEVSEGVLSPVFSQPRTSYSVEVNSNVNYITVTPVVYDVTSTVTVKGEPVISGTESGPIYLESGQNIIDIVVTSEDTVKTKTYTVVVTKLTYEQSSNNADLAGLSLSAGALTPSFDANHLFYDVEVNYDSTTITVTPTASGIGAAISVNETAVNSGSPSSLISLDEGENEIIVEVTAQDSVTTKTYTLTVTRLGYSESSNNADLAGLSLSVGILSPLFSVNETSYNSEVNYDVGNITATPTVAGTGATVTVNGTSVASGSPSFSITLDEGENEIIVEVTAQDSVTTKTYTVTVTKLTYEQSSNNADLAGLSLSSGTLSPDFSTNTLSYYAEVAYNRLSITVTPTVSGVNASVTVNGNPVISGTPSSSIYLTKGETETINIVVIAQNFTTRTCVVSVYRLNGPFSVYYNVGTGNTSGTVPSDNTLYNENQEVTVRGNTGNLVGPLVAGLHTGSGIKQRFIGWNSVAGSTTAEYVADDTFNITEDTTLYAVYTTDDEALRKVGPGGGWVFYDAGSNQTWGRYIEAAPESTEWTGIGWGKYGTSVGGTELEVGTGKNNTDLIVAKLNEPPAESGRAAQLCDGLSYGGYSDWYLPSSYELSYIGTRLYQHGIGDFYGKMYWSSSENIQNTAISAHTWFYTGNGSTGTATKTTQQSVRAVRAFSN